MAANHTHRNYAPFRVYVVTDTLEHARQAVCQSNCRLTNGEVTAVGNAAQDLTKVIDMTFKNSDFRELTPENRSIPDVVSGKTAGESFLNLITFFSEAIKERNPFDASELERIKRCALRLEGSALDDPRFRQ